MASQQIRTDLIRSAIKARGLSGREKLAIELEVSASYLDKLVSGERTPGPKTLARLLRALGVSEQDLVEPDEPRSA